MQQPKISVITVSLNQGEYIEKNIKSILAQDYQNFEHIVIDGGSTDNTIKILKKYPHLKWVSEKDRGQSHAMNKGLSRATGEIIYILNSDDMGDNGAFEAVAKFFIEHPTAKVVYGNCRIIDEDGQEVKIERPDFFDLKRQLNIGNMIKQEATFFKKEIIDKVGMMNEKYRYAMDYDLWCRAAKFYRFYKIDRVLGNFRIHPTSKTFFANEEYRKEAYSVSTSNGGSRISPIFLSRYGVIVRRAVGDNTFSAISSAYNDLKIKIWNIVHLK